MTRRAAIIAVAALAVVMSLGSLALAAIPHVVPLPDTYGFRGGAEAIVVSFAVAGAAIALRRPQNPVGWICLICGTFGALSQLTGEYASYALLEPGGGLAGGSWAAWVANWSVTLMLGPIASYLLLVFPDGRLPSPRWRPVAWLTLAGLALWTAGAAFLPGPLNNPGLGISNPLWQADQGGGQLQTVLGRAVLPLGALCAAGMVHRFRRARGIERQQLKWMAYAGAVVAVGVLLVPAASDRKPLQIIQMSTLFMIPAAAGIAMLRHRLYDIDVLIRRTLIYAGLSVVLLATYVGGVAFLQTILAPLTAGSGVAVAISTLAVVALFQPFRRRIQAAVDRRFYRAKYDAERTLDTFASRLRDEVDLGTVRADLLQAVHETVQPTHASVWLRR